MNARRVWRGLFVVGAIAVLMWVTPCLALKDNPYIITGYETSQSIIITPEEIAENYRIVINSEEDITPIENKGLACVLQSSRNKYWSNDDIFLCLRLFPAKKNSSITLDTRGELRIRVIRADSGKVVATAGYSETRRPVRAGVQDAHPQKVEITSGGSESGWTELDFLMTRHDFHLRGLKKGPYRIEMSYTSTSTEWVGEITAAPIEIEVLD